MRKLFILIFVGALVIPLFLAGCSKKPLSLSIGLVNSDRLLREWSKYRDQADLYAQERMNLFARLPSDPRKYTFEQKKEIMASKEKWEKIKEEILKEISEATRKVAREKKIDFVVDNPDSSPIVEYGGVDLTTDVLMILK